MLRHRSKWKPNTMKTIASILTFVCLLCFRLLLTKAYHSNTVLCIAVCAQVFDRMYFFCHAKLCAFFFYGIERITNNTALVSITSLNWNEFQDCLLFKLAMDMCMHQQIHKIYTLPVMELISSKKFSQPFVFFWNVWYSAFDFWILCAMA